MLRLIAALTFIVMPSFAMALTDVGVTDLGYEELTEIVTLEEIMAWRPNNTECATGVFADALAQHAAAIDETDDQATVQTWVHKVFADGDVLRAVLNCPEVAATPDTTQITFLPIEYEFPGGRKITIHYAAAPKLLKQRLALAGKRAINTNDASPAIGDDSGIVWSNTDPAWYAIMVTQSGALDEFVGPDKNNTISIKYINDNIDDLYPRGINTCTNRSALARDSAAINRAVTKTVGLADAGEKDTNDYYVAGDINLAWISYAEIALDVVITIATYGGGAAVLGATKATRASKTLKTLSTSLRELMKLDSVRDYIKATNQATHLAADIAKLDKVRDAAKIAEKTRELDTLRDTIKTLESVDDVKKYREASAAYSEINAYRHSLRGLRGLKTAKRGNVATRLWRALKAANTGNKTLNRGAKIARSSMKSGKVRDWLFHATMRSAGTLAKMEERGGLLYGIWKFGLDMYDHTDDSTDLYTNGMDFKPLLLLSADDIVGQENVVNYGMWLMWSGDSTSAADDDAAYLQAMDFAEKFHQDLTEIQDDTDDPCSVDIYVVRPIVRNPGDTDSSLYYLIMNDIPWTTAPRP